MAGEVNEAYAPVEFPSRTSLIERSAKWAACLLYKARRARSYEAPKRGHCTAVPWPLLLALVSNCNEAAIGLLRGNPAVPLGQPAIDKARPKFLSQKVQKLWIGVLTVC